MTKPIGVDLELKRAFIELQGKMVETRRKIQIIDYQINALKNHKQLLDCTQLEINALPPGTRTYESVGRMFLLKDLEKVKKNLKTRETQSTERTAELHHNKEYLQKNLKESEDNIREMIQQRKEQLEGK